MIEKYTQPSAYFPDFDHGSCLLAAISPGGLLLVILILILFAKSWRGIVGVPFGVKVHREGMAADVKTFRLYRGIRLGQSVRSLRSAIIRVCTGARGGSDAQVVLTVRGICCRRGRTLDCMAQGYLSLCRLSCSSMSF